MTLLAGAILVQRMPGLDASADLGEMTLLSAIVLLAAGALAGRRDTRRRLDEQQRVSRSAGPAGPAGGAGRIARELHDVVAHHMSVIAIQAEAAPYRPPEEAASSFATIRATATEGLAELRRVVGVLRADDLGSTPSPPSTGWTSWSPTDGRPA